MGSEHPALLHYLHMTPSTLDTLQQLGWHHGVSGRRWCSLLRGRYAEKGPGLKLVPADLKSWLVISASGVLPGTIDGAGPPEGLPT